MKRLAAVGIRPHARHGQNFLIDLNLLELLFQTAEITPDDVVLEVGTGVGSLTTIMAPAAAAVVTVEIDAHLAQLAREQLVAWDNVTILEQDALRNKNQLHAAVLSAVNERLSAAPDRRFKLVANLPYSVATPVISNLLAHEPVPDTMTVTIQKELADRMMASPGTRDYSALSIWIQAQADVELIRVLPPSVFWPRPKVNSAIIHIRVDRQRRDHIPDLDFFHRFVRAMFFHRRKYLRSSLVSAVKDQLDKNGVDEILAEMQFGPDARAEQLDVPTMLALAERVRARVADSGRTNE
jgi:16S rRNA (adenine1518-N6/adenine1519-N6)-dimethyltransferase